MSLCLRTAGPGDLALLRRWDDQPHVIASDPNSDWQWETELRRDPGWREQLIAELDGVPIGFIEIIDPQREDSHYWGDVGDNLRALDLWIGEAEYLNRGHGSEMLRQALARCFADANVRAVLIDPLASNLRAQRFYRRHGFVAIGERCFGPDLCLVHRLERKRWKALDPDA